MAKTNSQFIKEGFLGLPPWAKGVIAVGLLTGGAIIAYKIYQTLNKPDTEKGNKNLLKDNDKELASNEKLLKQSFPDSQYDSMANQIYEGMKYGADDNYPSVRNTLMKMKNDLDVNKLVKAYGSRQLYNFGIPVGDKKDLFTAVRSELGAEWMGLSSAKMDAVNKDWAKKKIHYRF